MKPDQEQVVLASLCIELDIGLLHLSWSRLPGVELSPLFLELTLVHFEFRLDVPQKFARPLDNPGRTVSQHPLLDIELGTQLDVLFGDGLEGLQDERVPGVEAGVLVHELAEGFGVGELQVVAPALLGAAQAYRVHVLVVRLSHAAVVEC